MKLRGELYSDKYGTSNGKRTYFFNVKKNREGDLFLNLVESLRKFDDRFERQEIVIYEEHIEKFRDIMNSVIDKLIELREDKGSHSSYESRDRRSSYDNDDSYGSYNQRNHSRDRDDRRRDNRDDGRRDDRRRDNRESRDNRDDSNHDGERHESRESRDDNNHDGGDE